jgi:hypothetical protein
LIEMMVESDEHHTEQSDEAEKRAQRHENLAKRFALALASKTGWSMRESGHVRGAEGSSKIPIFRADGQYDFSPRVVSYWAGDRLRAAAGGVRPPEATAGAGW